MSSESIKRRAPTKAEVIEILERQGVTIEPLPPGAMREAQSFALILAQCQRIPCGRFAVCGTWITSRKQCHRDHKISLRSVAAEQRREYDRPWNQWYLCLACHDQKTNKGGFGHGAHSDATLHAKLRRLEKRRHGEEGVRRCRNKISPRPWVKPSKSWPKGRKLQSRPFPKAPAKPSP